MIELWQTKQRVVNRHGNKNQQGQENVFDLADFPETTSRIGRVSHTHFFPQAAQPVLDGAKGTDKTTPCFIEKNKKQEKSHEPGQNAYTPSGKQAVKGESHLVLETHQVTGTAPVVGKDTGKSRKLVADINGQIAAIHQEDKSEPLNMKAKTTDATVV